VLARKFWKSFLSSLRKRTFTSSCKLLLVRTSVYMRTMRLLDFTTASTLGRRLATGDNVLTSLGTSTVLPFSHLRLADVRFPVYYFAAFPSLVICTLCIVSCSDHPPTKRPRFGKERSDEEQGTCLTDFSYLMLMLWPALTRHFPSNRRGVALYL
jgi:hypothetical protein